MIDLNEYYIITKNSSKIDCSSISNSLNTNISNKSTNNNYISKINKDDLVNNINKDLLNEENMSNINKNIISLRKFYNICLKIYKLVDEKYLHSCKEEINKMKDIGDKFKIAVFETKEEYLNFYKDKIKSLNLSSGGLTKEKFII